MTSDRQIAANRLNARKSTGPRTTTGKSRSRRNALRHGLTSQTVLKLTEDPNEYRRFERAIISDFNPVSTIERTLVVRVASLLWRLKRATAMETESLASPRVPDHETPAAVRTTSMHSTETALTAHAEPHSFVLEAIISRISTRTAEYMGDDFFADHAKSHARKLLENDTSRQINTGNQLSFDLILRYHTSLSRQLALTLLGITQVRQQTSSSIFLRRRRCHSK